METGLLSLYVLCMALYVTDDKLSREAAAGQEVNTDSQRWAGHQVFSTYLTKWEAGPGKV